MKRDRNELMLRRSDMITACINVDCIRAETRTTYPSMIFFFSIYAVKLDKKGQRYRDNNRCLSLV